MFCESSDQNFEYFWSPNRSEEMFWWFLQSKIWKIWVPKLIGGNVLINPPIKTLNIFGIQIDRKKCSDDSSNQKLEYLWCTNWLEEMFWEILRSKISILLVPKLIGGNVSRNPPIKNFNIVCSEIDWRKCSDDSSNPKFEYCWCRNWLDEMF